ncbi:hypothetical protein DAPPUDRAFT_231205 [Daphnia pulex]|uniref:Annexin n=1 Tax=Daphnia pulex TaxID=6669 RepID=E9GWA4_DAPPU|nr:hypothetical protein DAPPUDRAFT_231205 [Daphnia pulex]|eukprot:EFX76230.1 hypothetical protein DAPPUDRAFT_231205 [Daphnia pulex]
MTKFLSIELHETMARPGTEEDSLTEILMSRTNQELSEIDTFFSAYYGHTLISEIESDTVASNVVDQTSVQSDVISLYEGGPAMEGTLESTYIIIFSNRNFVHLNEVANLYEATYGTPLSDVVTTEFANVMGSALASILQYSRDKAVYFSSRFYTTIAGAGTAHRDLLRLTISRCETDLGNIKIAYQSLYGMSLSTAVTDDTSGSYQLALLALID